MKKALILQGWYQKTTSNWYLWLKDKLEERGYTVYLPDLPTVRTDLPDWERIKKAITDLLTIDENTIVIGHSLGCLMALRLAEQFIYKTMILVSGWDFNDLTIEHQLFWKTPLDHKKITNNVKDIVCVGSNNDPYFTFDTVESMSKRLNAKTIKVKDAGHFTEAFGVMEIPTILDFI